MSGNKLTVAGGCCCCCRCLARSASRCSAKSGTKRLRPTHRSWDEVIANHRTISEASSSPRPDDWPPPVVVIEFVGRNRTRIGRRPDDGRAQEIARHRRSFITRSIRRKRVRETYFLCSCRPSPASAAERASDAPTPPFAALAGVVGFAL